MPFIIDDIALLCLKLPNLLVKLLLILSVIVLLWSPSGVCISVKRFVEDIVNCLQL